MNDNYELWFKVRTITFNCTLFSKTHLPDEKVHALLLPPSLPPSLPTTNTTPPPPHTLLLPLSTPPPRPPLLSLPVRETFWPKHGFFWKSENSTERPVKEKTEASKTEQSEQIPDKMPRDCPKRVLPADDEIGPEWVQIPWFLPIFGLSQGDKEEEKHRCTENIKRKHFSVKTRK